LGRWEGTPRAVAKGGGSEGGTPLSLRALLDRVSWRLPFDGSVDPEQLQRRLLAAAGLWFLLAGFLATLGLGIVLLASLALLLVGSVLAGGFWLVRRYRVGRRLRVAVLSIEQLSRTLRARVVELGARQRLQRFAELASAEVHRRLPQREPAAAHLEGQALRLNELGAQLRREGNYQEAAEHHRQALTIARERGDRQAEALTLNNLALALLHVTGGVPVAVQHFHQALVLLRELGDEEHEGQVIANLGFLRRRQGRDEDAKTLLHEALDKLPPDSSAYHQIEAQLSRAS
jgi:tetratricopeptide (TPR) repeat protein